MSIWYSISTHFTLRPDADRHALERAVTDYEEATVPNVIQLEGDTVWAEAEGDMSRNTADLLYAGLVQLIQNFSDGKTVRVYTRSSDDEELHCHYVGRKAAVVATLDDDLARRIEAIRAAYICQINDLADKADDAFVEVETEAW